jgi:hypothetical protein
MNVNRSAVHSVRIGIIQTHFFLIMSDSKINLHAQYHRITEQRDQKNHYEA